MKISKTKVLSALLSPLVSRADQLSLRINELIAAGAIAGTEIAGLVSEREQIEIQLGQILGDQGTDRSTRTSIWRARAVLAEGQG